jgi:YD repeat-containing protein
MKSIAAVVIALLPSLALALTQPLPQPRSWSPTSSAQVECWLCAGWSRRSHEPNVCCTGAALAASTTQTFYDKSGRVTGKARTEDGVTTYYDAAGRVVGKARERR